MPSLLHEALVSLFRNRPTLAPELMREALRQQLPDYDEVQLEDADLSQLTPTEYRADLVVLLRASDPVYAIVVEVQLGRDDDKPYSWPLYAAALRARLRCPTCVLVVAPDAAVARWASRPIGMGQPGSCFVPLVLGPRACRGSAIRASRRSWQCSRCRPTAGTRGRCTWRSPRCKPCAASVTSAGCYTVI